MHGSRLYPRPSSPPFLSSPLHHADTLPSPAPSAAGTGTVDVTHPTRAQPPPDPAFMQASQPSPQPACVPDAMLKGDFFLPEPFQCQ